MHDRKRPLSGLLSDLAGVVSDLSRRNEEAGQRLTEALRESPALPDIPDFPAAPAEKAPAPAGSPALPDIPTLPELPLPPGGLFPPASTRQKAPTAPQTAPPSPAPLSLDGLWKTADEPIDWTEALASPTPTDGLTAPDKWALYHEQAASVLHGDLAAYRRVLSAADPMADLVPYTARLAVEPISSDEVRAEFALRPELAAAEPRRALCALALRIARDVFAVLPVTRVSVEAREEDSPRLRVAYERQQLARVRFAFIDPVELTLSCGGAFPEA